MEKKKTTSVEVAKLAGVSQTTVSLILNGNTKSSFSEETKQRVYKAARELNYTLPIHKDAEAAATKIILLLIPTLSNQFYAELVQTLQQYSDTLGYRMIVCNTFRKKELEKFYLEQFSNTLASGIIYTFLPNFPEEVIYLSRKIPVVLIGEKTESLPICSIELKNRTAGIMIAEHLYSLGHRHLTFISTPTNQLTLSRSQRLEGLQQGLRACGKRDNCSVSIDTLIAAANMERDSALDSPPYEFQIGKTLTEEFLNKKSRSTALIGANDMIAFGILAALQEQGCKVPEDYSVCGFDNIFTSSIISPQLTTIDHRLIARCRSAVDLISQIDTSHNHLPRDVLLADRIEYTPRLVVRNSTGIAISRK